LLLIYSNPNFENGLLFPPPHNHCCSIKVSAIWTAPSTIKQVNHGH